MKRLIPILTIATLFLIILVPGLGHPRSVESEDRTLSPFFFIKSDHPGPDQLPLKTTSAQVNISGVIADVLVTQVYKNEGRHPLEAIYIFRPQPGRRSTA